MEDETRNTGSLTALHFRIYYIKYKVRHVKVGIGYYRFALSDMRDNKGTETPRHHVLNILQNFSYDLLLI